MQAPVLLPKVRWRNSVRPECLSYKEEAGGSNPSASTKCGRSVKGPAREVVALAVWVQIPSVTPIEECPDRLAVRMPGFQSGDASSILARGTKSAGVVQLAERFLGKEEIAGSNPAVSSKFEPL